MALFEKGKDVSYLGVPMPYTRLSWTKVDPRTRVVPESPGSGTLARDTHALTIRQDDFLCSEPGEPRRHARGEIGCVRKRVQEAGRGKQTAGRRDEDAERRCVNDLPTLVGREVVNNSWR